MNDVEELKQFIVVHAHLQNIPRARYEAVLARVANDEEGAEGSWTREWIRSGEELERAGKPLEACRSYSLARFPFVDGPARQEALTRAVAAFDAWRGTVRVPVERLDIALPGGTVAAWASGLARAGAPAAERRPVVLLSGGIVSTKEQFGPVLLTLARLGVAAVALEMPGVGENTLTYAADSHTMVTGVLDALAERADVAETYALMMSFSGHLALGAALADPRVRGVVTGGAPIADFFTDEAWRPRIPRVTVDTLAHLTGVKPEAVLASLTGWALTPERLAALRIPVAYIASGRDEIIPPADARLLREHVRDVRVLVHDDVHGAPRHVTESRLWSVEAFLRMRGGAVPQRAVLQAVLFALRLRGRVAAGRP